MNPWRDVLKSVQKELERRSQEVEGRPVLPNGISVRLPVARFGRFSPLLEAVTTELGEALVEWAARSGHSWYAAMGPFLHVELVAEGELETAWAFLKSPPEE